MDAITLYNFEGRAVAYIYDGKYIYLYGGRPVAFLYEQYVYAYSDPGYFTPTLSINRVVPIFAATSSRTGPSFTDATGASVSAWRASR